jgi:hypothetical protein
MEGVGVEILMLALLVLLVVATAGIIRLCERLEV